MSNINLQHQDQNPDDWPTPEPFVERVRHIRDSATLQYTKDTAQAFCQWILKHFTLDNHQKWDMETWQEAAFAHDWIRKELKPVASKTLLHQHELGQVIANIKAVLFNVLLGRWKAKFGNADICTTFGVPHELSHAVTAIQRLVLEAKPGNLNRDKRVNFLQALDDFEAEMQKPDKSSRDLVSTR
ncbi:hypothetical protein JCM3766R1_004074 [Sporobolomyces carnicolor]